MIVEKRKWNQDQLGNTLHRHLGKNCGSVFTMAARIENNRVERLVSLIFIAKLQGR